MLPQDFEDIITRTLRGCEAEHSRCRLWGAPRCALVSAADPRFAGLKERVSPTHLLPVDILPGAGTVLVFFIPFDESIIRSNASGEAASREAAAGEAASREWAQAYILTNDAIRCIGEALAASLAAGGFRGGKIPATHNFDEERLVSDWSHRHVAEIAGLGSFGMNNMLITDSGCCGRLGSLVTDWTPLRGAGKAVTDPTTDRDGGGGYAGTETAGTTTAPPSAAPVERCLHKRGIPCLACQKRCPAGAYTTTGFDRRRCHAKCLENAARFKDLGLADVCGKCLVSLPCSTKTPA